MALKDKLEIILITFNRKKCLERTFSYIFAEDSPVKDLNITVLDNNSYDGTSEFIQEYAKDYPNINYIKNNRNIGGNGNIAKAFEIAKFPYLWIMCDDDYYDWSNFDEIEQAIEDNYDLIYTQILECEKEGNLDRVFTTACFVPLVIHKTENLTDTIMDNMMFNISNLFPHLAPVADCINEGKKTFHPTKNIVHTGIDNYDEDTLYRGLKRGYLHPYRQANCMCTAFFNSAMLIKDKKLRNRIIENIQFYGKNLFENLYNQFMRNKLCNRSNFKNFFDMFCVFNFIHKIILITAYLAYFTNYNLLINRALPSLKTKFHYKQFFENIDFHKTLKKLKRKYKNKKIVIYGAGMMFEAIKENYNLSGLNIIAISDKKFEKEEVFEGFRAVPPAKIKELDPDVIFVGMYNINLCLEFIKSLNVKYEYLAKKPFYIQLHKIV